MNYVRFAENKTSHGQIVMKEVASGSASARSNAGIISLCFSILVMVVGLPALLFFLAMGGMFAVVGPWVILAGTLAIRKRPGWQVFGIISGGGFLFLGAATLVLPIHAGRLEMIGGVFELLLGLGYLAAPLFEMRRKL